VALKYLPDPSEDPKTYYINRSILAKSSEFLNGLLNSPGARKDDEIASLQTDTNGGETLTINGYESEDVEIKQAAFECFLQYAYLHLYSLVELDKADLGKRLLLHTHVYVLARRLQAYGLLERASDGMLDILLEQMEEEVDALSVLSALDLL